MRKKRLLTTLTGMWQPLLLTVASALALGGVLLFRLESIAPSLAPAEFNILQRSASDILADPLFLHQQVLQKLAFIATDNQLLAVRLPSVLTGMVAVYAFYSLVSLWFSKRVAVFSSLLLTTAAWFLHVARIGTTDAAYLLPLAGVVFAAWLHSRRQSIFAVIGFVLLALTMLYIPGLLWFMVPALIWQRSLLLQSLKKLHRWQLALITIVLLAGIAPLVIALARDPKFALELLALPDTLSSLAGAPREALRVIADVFLYRQANPLMGIGHLPYLSVFTSAMIALGVFAAIHNRKLDRVRLLAGLLVGGVLLSAVSQSFSPAFLIPPLFLLATGGIALLLQQWFTVFPRNPFARQAGVVVVLAAIAVASLLGVTRYFIAWPHTPATGEVFSAQTD